MTMRTIAGINVETDGEGFLCDSKVWTKEMATVLAHEEGIGSLTEEHWKVIDFMRKVTAESGQSPSVRKIGKQSGVDIKTLYALFPGGPGKKAAKISGVPKPVGCV